MSAVTPASPARLGVLFLIALLPRLIFWLEWNHAGLISLPVVDADTFHKEALGLTRGTFPPAEPFWQAPLYSYFLGGIYRLFGVNWPAARFIQALLGSGTCVLAWVIARRVLRARWALVVFGLCALYGPLIYYEGQLLRETLATFLLLLWTVLHLRIAVPDPRPGPGPQAARGLGGGPSGAPLLWAASGALLGLAAICRENALALAPLAIVHALLFREGPPAAPAADRAAPATDRAASHVGKGRRLGPAALFTAGLVLALAPVTAHNWRFEKRLIPVSWSGGVNFWLGNNANSRQTIAIRPGRFWQELVDRPVREANMRTDGERQAFFTREAFRWIAGHPGAFLANTLYKTVGFLSAHEVRRNQDLYEGRQGSVLLRLLFWRAGPFAFPFGLLGPAALIGLYLCTRRKVRDPRLDFLALATGVYALAVILFFPNARYRVPLVPYLAIFGSLGIGALLSALRGTAGPALVEAWSGRRGGVREIAMAGALALVLVDGGWVRAVDSPADQAFQRATALADAGRTEEAMGELERAVEINPGFGQAWTTMAAINGRSGRPMEAAACALNALRADSTDVQALINLGTAWVVHGDLVRGEAPLRKAVRMRPDMADGWQSLAMLQSAQGKPAEAEQSYRRALSLDPGLAAARTGLAQQLVRAARYEEGRTLLQEGLDRAPGDPALWTALGNLEGYAGQWIPAENAFRRSLDLAPNDPDAWNNYGLVLIQLGRRDEAARAFDRAIALRPDHAQALANRRRLIEGR